MYSKSHSCVRNLALSVRQPLADFIMFGLKKIEFRTVPTNIGGRVYIYASKAPNLGWYEKLGLRPGDLSVGVVIGGVEIIGCSEEPDENDEYHWQLANPKRLRKPFKPDTQPQPVWFKPFKE
jgi:hypothetical protein